MISRQEAREILAREKTTAENDLKDIDMPMRVKHQVRREIEAFDMAIQALSDPATFPGPTVHPQNLDDNTFLIVERQSVEAYSKDQHLPTPMPKGAYAAPLDAQVITWNETKENPPTEEDTSYHGASWTIKGDVVAVDRRGRAEIAFWKFVATSPEDYPLWSRILTPTARIVKKLIEARKIKRKEENNG